MKKIIALFLFGAAAVAADTGELLCTVTDPISPSVAMFGLNQVPTLGETTKLRRTALEISEIKFSQGGTIPLKALGARLYRRLELGEESKSSPIIFDGVASSRTSDYSGLLLIYPEIEGKSTVHFQALRKAVRGFRAPHMELYTLYLSCEALK